nr:permease [Acidimicrobiia bacterium]
KSPDEVNGIKKIILNLALPATIFIALMGITVESSLLLLPLLALTFNVVLFVAAPFLLAAVGVKKESPAYRTGRLLIPSLAPGLSCFPFVLEFLGEAYLAKAAMADLGNKVFVLVILYLVAMQWYYSRNQEVNKRSSAKIMSLLKTLVTEPVNVFIALALLLLSFGFTMGSLPFVIGETLTKLSLILTPLVLLFIGLAVKIRREQFFQIFSLLTLRAGLVFILAALLVSVGGFNVQKDVLLMLAFGLSACSFWPFAHLSLIENLEIEKERKTFDSTYAIGILALSFPFSTVMILSVLNSGTFFNTTGNLWWVGFLILLIGSIYPLFNLLSRKTTAIRISGPELEPTKPEQA